MVGGTHHDRGCGGPPGGVLISGRTVGREVRRQQRHKVGLQGVSLKAVAVRCHRAILAQLGRSVGSEQLREAAVQLAQTARVAFKSPLQLGQRLDAAR